MKMGALSFTQIDKGEPAPTLVMPLFEPRHLERPVLTLLGVNPQLHW
jgi:hypothetical protein